MYFTFIKILLFSLFQSNLYYLCTLCIKFDKNYQQKKSKNKKKIQIVSIANRSFSRLVSIKLFVFQQFSILIIAKNLNIKLSHSRNYFPLFRWLLRTYINCKRIRILIATHKNFLRNCRRIGQSRSQTTHVCRFCIIFPQPLSFISLYSH